MIGWEKKTGYLAKQVETYTDSVYIWDLHIVESRIWKCPVLYFRIQDLSGSPVSPFKFKEIEFISQEEHPVLGMPFYFIHPCQSSLLIKELQVKEEDRVMFLPRIEAALVLEWIYLQDFADITFGSILGLGIGYQIHELTKQPEKKQVQISKEEILQKLATKN
ncbi:E2-like conjugating enzyme atg10 [Boothiomyces sp. JEL0866]|nr:E2-like conjugating enzyme atg10 [Boothiomyces sp. JEL0866]KAJ3322419.1 E2-like conjugating enzyme atg10 [Boothiomyces sp. JEL0866]